MLVEERNYTNDTKHSIIYTVSRITREIFVATWSYRNRFRLVLLVRNSKVATSDVSRREEEERRLVQVPFDASQLKSPSEKVGDPISLAVPFDAEYKSNR